MQLKRTHEAITLLAVAMFSTATFAGTSTQVFSYDWNQTQPMPTLTFDSFDTQGGQLQLDQVRFDLEGGIYMAAWAENIGPDPVLDWSLDLSAITRLEFLWDDEFGVTLGGAAFPTLFADLAGSDSEEGSGDDYIEFEPMFAPVDGTWNVPGERLADFADAGALSAAMILSPSAGVGPGPVTFGLSAYEQSGSIVVTYTYSQVPAPAALALFAFTGAFITHRRRRF